MKKRYLLLSFMICVLGSRLKFVNMYYLNMPELVTVIAAGLMAGAAVLFFKKGNGKLFSKILVTGYTLIFAAVTILGAYCNPYWNSLIYKEAGYTKSGSQELSYREAKKDIDYLMHYLKKNHPMFLKGVPPDVQEAYETALDELKEADTVTVTLIHQKMQNITSVLKDAHTRAEAQYAALHRLEDLSTRLDSGMELKAVNGTALQELLEQKENLYSFELKSREEDSMISHLGTLEGLNFLGLDPDGIRYTYQTDTGEETECTYYPDDFVFKEADEADTSGDEDGISFVSYTVDPEKSLAVLTLNECNYNEEYRNCLKEMFAEVAASDIRNVAVDLRNNGGGNSSVANEFLHYLDIDSYKGIGARVRYGPFCPESEPEMQTNSKYQDLLFHGRVFLLTSSKTFSSAMLFAEYIKDNQLGVIIGEAPGNAPVGCGDIAVFQAPSSGLYFKVSTKYFLRADSEAEENVIAPDISCDEADALKVLDENLL